MDRQMGETVFDRRRNLLMPLAGLVRGHQRTKCDIIRWPWTQMVGQCANCWLPGEDYSILGATVTAERAEAKQIGIGMLVRALTDEGEGEGQRLLPRLFYEHMRTHGDNGDSPKP